MSFPHSHKTVVVLDRSPHFLELSNETIEYDIFVKSRAPGIIPMAPIVKTLWTCNVEAVMEYCRIVYDIFPMRKLIRFITSDTDSASLNSWSQTEQNTQQLMLALAHLGPLNAAAADMDDCSVMHGLTQAIQVLCEPSQIQHGVRTSLTESADNILNRGRIICLTSVRSEAHALMLEECVQDALVQHNKLAASSDNLMPIHHCELELVHVIPIGAESVVTEKPSKDVSAFLSSELHVTQSGKDIALKLVQLVQRHYDLASTTVTGIPMKEEQNASSSANYDVELLHPARAHYDLVASANKHNPGNADGLIIPTRECLHTETVTLKWCTPKSNTIELQQCTGAFRISPVDVNSRPSSCLTNFLLSGRAVMLEQPRKSGAKIISHMLASHGGEIYIHVLNIARTILEDPPSISEGCGGRVTDYRINDFGELMKECRLIPSTESTTLGTEQPVQRSKNQLERMTRHWPMVIGDTLIFNMLSHLDPLPSLIVKAHLDEDDVLECKKSIYHVVGIESRNEPLPVPTVGSRGKGPKREEHYRQMWAELEMFVRAHSSTSPNHAKVLECLLECKKPSEDSKIATTPKKQKEEKPEPMETEQTWKELERYQKLTEREKHDLNSRSDIKTPDSPPMKKFKTETGFGKGTGTQSLLSLWTSRINAVHKQRHAEFAGRLESSGNIAELYPQLNEDDNPGEVTTNSGKKT